MLHFLHGTLGQSSGAQEICKMGHTSGADGATTVLSNGDAAVSYTPSSLLDSLSDSTEPAFYKCSRAYELFQAKFCHAGNRSHTGAELLAALQAQDMRFLILHYLQTDRVMCDNGTTYWPFFVRKNTFLGTSSTLWYSV